MANVFLRPAGGAETPVLLPQSCHEESCPAMLVACPACHNLVRLGEKEQHVEQECPERSLSCKHCQALFHFSESKVWSHP